MGPVQLFAQPILQNASHAAVQERSRAAERGRRAAACAQRARPRSREVPVPNSWVAIQERFARKNEGAELRRAFDTLDSKSDGRLDAEELGRVLARLNHKARKARGPSQGLGIRSSVSLAPGLDGAMGGRKHAGNWAHQCASTLSVCCRGSTFARKARGFSRSDGAGLERKHAETGPSCACPSLPTSLRGSITRRGRRVA